MVNIGLITIGQTPRNDILLDWKYAPETINKYRSMEKLEPSSDSLIPKNIIFYHIGALDEFTPKTMHQIEPEPDERAMVSRLRDGSWQKISHHKIKPLIIQCVEKLIQKKCKGIVILCTGYFSYITYDGILLESGKICRNLIDSLLRKDDVLCVFSPLHQEKTQQKPIPIKNPRFGNRNVIRVSSNPYILPEEKIIPAVEEVKNNDFKLIYLNCLGYSYKHKAIVEKMLGKPAILPRSVLAWTLADLFSKTDY